MEAIVLLIIVFVIGLLVGWYTGGVYIYRALRTEARTGIISFNEEHYRTNKVQKITQYT
jgi:hypothetical protein